MDIHRALELLQDDHRGVLVTQRRNGRPQLSNILYAVGADGVIRISVTDERAKTANLRRTPVASLYHSPREDFRRYVVVDADVELSAVAADPGDATVDELGELYQAAAGEHPDWDDFRLGMVRDRRLVIRLRPTHAYGMWAER